MQHFIILWFAETLMWSCMHYVRNKVPGYNHHIKDLRKKIVWLPGCPNCSQVRQNRVLQETSVDGFFWCFPFKLLINYYFTRLISLQRQPNKNLFINLNSTWLSASPKTLQADWNVREAAAQTLENVCVELNFVGRLPVVLHYSPWLIKYLRTKYDLHPFLLSAIAKLLMVKWDIEF